LEPNRGSLQKTIGGRSLLALKHAKPMLKTPKGVIPEEPSFYATGA
jgi:hypothetical protein